jgi:plastocyanin
VQFARGCGVAIAGLLLLTGTAASAADEKPAPRAYTVVVENMRFDPQTLIVKSGGRVKWVNKDLFPHTVTADGKAFDSHGIEPNGSWVFVAHKSGIYTYACAFHPTMKGTITVQ